MPDELPRYLLEVNGADVSPDVKEANAFDDEVWWHSHREKLPHWLTSKNDFGNYLELFQSGFGTCFGTVLELLWNCFGNKVFQK